MTTLNELNPQQLEAATSNHPRLLCLAAAGTGKTKTLIARIARLVNEGVDPRSILALTFTNAAALEMKDRYKKCPDVDLSKGIPEFRTFHSFCYSLIIKDTTIRGKIGYSQIPEICDDTHLKEIKKRVKFQLGITLSDDVLESGRSAIKKEQDQIDLYKKQLSKTLKAENVITFDIMCYNVCELFDRKDPCTDLYKKKYTYLLCDECQDTDPKQSRFISSFPETTNFFLCGDILQNIYAFRNCTNDLIKALVGSPDWKVVKLYKNYRSTRQICEFANKFSRYANSDFRIEMEGQRDGDPVEVKYGSHSTFAHPVDLDHLSILANKIRSSKGECAVLCRSNREVASVKDYLTRQGIQFTGRTKQTDAVQILESALSNEYMLEWLSTKLEAKDYGDYLRLSAIEPNPDIHWFLIKYYRKDEIRKAADKITEVRTIISSKDTLEHKFESVTKLLKVKSKCTFDEDKVRTDEDIITTIINTLQELEETQVYVGTIHSSKGLEYETVYVMGVDDNLFQLGTEEMNNLAYVAYTRAKDHLVVFRQ